MSKFKALLNYHLLDTQAYCASVARLQFQCDKSKQITTNNNQCQYYVQSSAIKLHILFCAM